MIPIHDNVPTERVPVVTVAIIIINSVLFIMEAMMPDDELMKFLFHWGYIPAKIFRPEYVHAEKFGLVAQTEYSLAESLMPAFTSMFLHGGWLHVIGNMWILWIFGNNVEDRLGPIGYFFFYILCGLSSAVVHTISAPTSPVVTIGASGAIAGVMGAYLLLYPRAQVLTMIPIFFFLYFAYVPAFLFLFVWFIIQIFSGVATVAAAQGEVLTGGVAWWAHVGGFVAGAGFVLVSGIHGTHGYTRAKPRDRNIMSGRRRDQDS